MVCCVGRIELGIFRSAPEVVGNMFDFRTGFGVVSVPHPELRQKLYHKQLKPISQHTKTNATTEPSKTTKQRNTAEHNRTKRCAFSEKLGEKCGNAVFLKGLPEK